MVLLLEINYNICKKDQQQSPIAYDTLYYDFESIQVNEMSDSEISEQESDISDKNDQETVLREVEEMNNKYSFISIKTEKKKKRISKEKKEILEEEEYIL